MLDLKYIDFLNNEINLTDNPDFWLVDVSGLTECKTRLSTYTSAYSDGDTVTNIVADFREIILTIVYKRTANVEQATRRTLLRFRNKTTGKLIWRQNGRVWEIGTVVEAVNEPRFSNSVNCLISLHCPDPYWTDRLDTIYDFKTEISGGLYFQKTTAQNREMLRFDQPDAEPAEAHFATISRNTDSDVGQFSGTVINDGDDAAEPVIEMTGLGSVTQNSYPWLNFSYGFAEPNTNLALSKGGYHIASGEKVTIICKTGGKEIKSSNAVAYPKGLLYALNPGDPFPKIAVGRTNFIFPSFLDVKIKFKKRHI